ncbi:hypothetical protein [Lysinibacter sp. HNR]|uniref:hypothetical protein n=1 Tax=Lysinibacter sp. HNR TaxID=3031408 RepID=UPI002434E5B6|nr:hypothetical protein [Lysinibacter sp. HNR]WGD38468.1 hypothetical protein FrondiHNR_06045 [Lysinibacter sp. HNR]
MSGVMGRPTLHRQDVAVGVGRSQSFGFRWYRDDGQEKTLVDVRAGTATVRFESLTGEVWKEFSARIFNDSLIQIELDPSSLAGPEWASRSTGVWHLRVTLDDITTQVVSGYLYLSH